MHGPGELSSIRIEVPIGILTYEFLPISLRGPDAMPCMKRSDATGREDLAMKQVPMALERANANDHRIRCSEVPCCRKPGTWHSGRVPNDSQEVEGMGQRSRN